VVNFTFVCFITTPFFPKIIWQYYIIFVANCKEKEDSARFF
jgi:hypothetical protein